jgi:preprotein translocase subunit Sss1
MEDTWNTINNSLLAVNQTLREICGVLKSQRPSRFEQIAGILATVVTIVGVVGSINLIIHWFGG